MKKKRKYTRKKKHGKIFFFKKVILYVCLGVFLHIIYVNANIIFSNPNESDIILIVADDNQNSKNITLDNQVILNESIELFNKNYVQKILILGEINKFGIDTNTIINKYLLEKEIWGGNIAYEKSNSLQIAKNSSLFLQKNQWNSLLTVSSFGNIGKIKYHLGTQINKKFISIQPVYLGIYDSILGVFSNYYYFWKI